MHIPDGYLGPQTYVPLYAAFVSFMALAVKILKKTLQSRMVPYLGMASCFSFLIMMFNVPIPGATTGHAVGSALIGLVLGPWAAILSVSITLIIQALVFGDGGITTIGANCVNMAVVMPLTAILTYKLIAGKSGSLSRIRFAAFTSGYVSLNIAAVVTAIQFGIQPLIAQDATGKPLYAPYPLNIAIPAMAAEHLILFGFIEAVITMLLFSYLYKTNKDIIYITH